MQFRVQASAERPELMVFRSRFKPGESVLCDPYDPTILRSDGHLIDVNCDARTSYCFAVGAGNHQLTVSGVPADLVPGDFGDIRCQDRWRARHQNGEE